MLLDTSILVDHLRGHPDARRVLNQRLRSGAPAYASTVTRIELLAGGRPEDADALARLFGLLRWVPLTSTITDLAGEYAAEFRRPGASVDIADCAIAATATSLSLDLWTRNVRHFPMFPDLAAPY